MKKDKQEAARALRKQGCTLKEIVDELKVAKSSVSLWVRDIKLTKSQIKRIKKKQSDNAKKHILRREGDISGKRREMGEEAWQEHKRLQSDNKNLLIRLRHPEKYVNRSVNVKQRLVDYKGGKCEKCGYNACLGALEFHHRNPDEKDFAVSSNHRSFEKLKLEVDKCDLLCNRCHVEVHWVLHKKKREARIKALKQKALEIL